MRYTDLFLDLPESLSVERLSPFASHEGISYLIQFPMDPNHLCDSAFAYMLKEYFWQYWVADRQGDFPDLDLATFCQLPFIGWEGSHDSMAADDFSDFLERRDSIASVMGAERIAMTHIHSVFHAKVMAIAWESRPDAERGEAAQRGGEGREEPGAGAIAQNIAQLRVGLPVEITPEALDAFVERGGNDYLEKIRSDPNYRMDSLCSTLLRKYVWEYCKVLPGGNSENVSFKDLRGLRLVADEGGESVASLMGIGNLGMRRIIDNFIEVIEEATSGARYDGIRDGIARGDEKDYRDAMKDWIGTTGTNDADELLGGLVHYCRAVLDADERGWVSRLLDPDVYPHARKALERETVRALIGAKNASPKALPAWQRYCTDRGVSDSARSDIERMVGQAVEGGGAVLTLMSKIAGLRLPRVRIGQLRRAIQREPLY